jgi:hypothetical protein
MKTPTALVTGAAVGATVAALAMLGTPARRVAAPAAETTELRRSLRQAERTAAEAREEARLAREALAARDRPAASPPPGPTAAAPAGPAVDARTTAIMTYLGEAVPAPATLDPKYSAAQLAEAFRQLCAARGVSVAKLGVDTSEFPFVLHGVLDGETARDFFLQIDARLRSAPGYAYGGSVTGRTTEGGLHFSLNMTPSSAYPHGHADAIRRRLLLRLQMIDAAWVDLVR